MKKIENAKKSILPTKNNQLDCKYNTNTINQGIKTSRSQILHLSQQIQNQITKKQTNHIKYTQNQQHKIIQQTQGDLDEDDSSQQSQTSNQNKNNIQKAIQNSLRLYFGIGIDSSYQKNKRQDFKSQKMGHLTDLDSYEEYKRIRRFNINFKQILLKLQRLRSVSLHLPQIGNSELKSQLEILILIEEAAKAQTRSLRNEGSLKSEDKMLELILKMQELQEQIQTRLSLSKEQTEYKKRFIEQIENNSRRIQEDIELVKNRNFKLKKELDSLQGIQSFQETSQEQQLDQIPPTLQPQKNSSSASENQQTRDCQKQYRDLMAYYQLFDPKTQIIEQPFPKNKTQAMMLLNKIQAKIQQLQILKTLKTLNS